MGRKQVTIARHTFFYKTFFTKHRDFLGELSEINFTKVNLGYEKLIVFYSSYSYYLKEDDKDDYLKKLIWEKVEELKLNKQYMQIAKKVNSGGLGSLDYEELKDLNVNFYKYLKSILEIFEIFCNRFAPSDIFPKIANTSEEYDLNLIFVVYDTFYESLFNLHSKIHKQLADFNLYTIQELFKILMVFFYGYSYYLQKDTIKVLKDNFNELYGFFENKEFLEIYFNFIQGNLSAQGLKEMKTYRDSIFKIAMDIYEGINSDLPKSNLFPKRSEKVTVDLTLI